MAKIAIAGTGYVGLSLATLLSSEIDNDVMAVDINKERVDKINRREPPIKDEGIENYFKNEILNLTATTDWKEGYGEAEYVIIAVPTNYDPQINSFDTSCVESVIEQVLSVNPNAVIVIKSTVPIGFTDEMSEKYGAKFLFSPEFLREGHALNDNLFPSRIIVGIPVKSKHFLGVEAGEFLDLLSSASNLGPANFNPNALIMGAKEAECVKLFSNTYLAMRVAYFNELDTFAQEKGLDTKSIITGVCMDPRIGDGYNNPSFGYGGYCFPKDTKQLRWDYGQIPQALISAVVDSNYERKRVIAKKIMESLAGKENPTIGIFRLTMKSGSDNFRESAIQDVLFRLRGYVPIIIYEPTLNQNEFMECKVVNDFNEFAEKSSIIVANRYEDILKDVEEKVFTRDIFKRD